MIDFSHLLGNPIAKEQLRKLVEKKRVPGALLLAGPEGVGKSLFAKALAAELLSSIKSQHPDLYMHAPTGKGGIHAIETIRELLAEVALPPFEAPAKVFILDDAERMLPSSAHALLKTLEEPPLACHFILVSSQPEQLLPTLLSRCATVSFFPVGDEEVQRFLTAHFSLSAEEMRRIILLAGGSLAKARRLAENKERRFSEMVTELFTQNNFDLLQTFDEFTPEEVGSLLEEIALFFRDQRDEMRTLLPLLVESREALERHMKPSVALQTLLLQTRLG